MSRGYRGSSRTFDGVNSFRRAADRDSSKTITRELTDLAQEQPEGKLIASIDEHAVKSIIIHPRIRECEYIASYNWANRGTPAILVPGAPPMWCPPARETHLKQDSGEYFRDPNAARYPNYPTEPAIRAIYKTEPSFDQGKIDVVACGNTLGSLLKCAASVERTFRFEVNIIGNAAFFVRKESSPTALIPGVYGYGHTFPESHTQWDSDVKGSVSHQRIIKYVFGDLNCLVRFESDGYLKDRAPKKTTTLPEANGAKLEMSSLLEAADSATISGRSGIIKGNLHIESKGRPIPQEAIFDLKTRSFRKEIDMGEVLPRLWTIQTPNFIIGYHKSGLFDDIRIQDVDLKLRQWEDNNQVVLSRMYALIRKIIELAYANGNKVDIFRQGSGPLQVHAHSDDSWSALPPDLVAKWELAEKSGGITEDSTEGPRYSRDSSPGSDMWGDDSPGSGSDAESAKDYTACSLEDCGYCGHCDY